MSTVEPGDAGARVRLARTGFADGTAYHAARPDYPDAALDAAMTAVGLGASAHVVDLGAGTGILTAQLVERFARVTAVEPSAGMRRVLEHTVPGACAVAGRDTSIPLPEASCDAVFVAQAFHWFDASDALREIARVLVPGGALVVLWNNRDESVEWVSEFSRAMRWDRNRPYSPDTDYAAVLAAGPFDNVTHRSFPHAQPVTRDQLYERVRSTSYVVAMSEDERALLMADVRLVVGGLVEPVVFPYVTDVYWCVSAADRSEDR
jgi:SAM-dependent methyltransferase